METAQILRHPGTRVAAALARMLPLNEARNAALREFSERVDRLRGHPSLTALATALRAELGAASASLWMLERDAAGHGRLVCRGACGASLPESETGIDRLACLHGAALSQYLSDLAQRRGVCIGTCGDTDGLEVLVGAEDEPLGVLKVRAATLLDPAWRAAALALCRYAAAECAALLLHDRAQGERRGACRDPVTGLPGREAGERLFDALGGGAAGPVHALFIDVGNFAFLSATLGQAVADQVLARAADRLRGAAGKDVHLVRYGDDRFLALTAGHDAAQLADALLAALDAPIDSAREIVCIAANVGTAATHLATGPESGDPPYLALLRRAEVALRRAKETGPGTAIAYGHELRMSMRRSAQLESQLKAALKAREISVVIQPQVDCRTGRLAGGEALARWHSATLGEISPATFIPIAEGSTLIHSLGQHLLDLVCREIASRKALAAPIAFNVSARQLLARDFVENLQQALAVHGLGPQCLELEITESALVEVGTAAGSAVTRLSELGFAIVMDDFGTGYSNLSLLKNLPISKIKLDGSLLEKVPGDAKNGAIVAAALQMAHTLGATVVAERVENEAQFAFLRDLGCDAAQGYFISRPASPQDFWAMSARRFGP